MKGLLLFAVVGILGYYAYHHWLAKPEPPPPPPPAVPAAKVVEAKPEPVNFAVKSRVRNLLEEWKRRELGTPAREQGTAALDPALELTEIRKTLFRDGVHSEAAVHDVIKRALRELGVAEKEINEVAAGIVGMR